MSATVPHEHWKPDTSLDRWMQVSETCDRWCERCRHRARCAMAGAPLNGSLDPAAVPKPPPEVLEARFLQMKEVLRELCEAEGCPMPELEARPAPLFEDDPLMGAVRAWREGVDTWLEVLGTTPRDSEDGRRLEVLDWHRWLVPGKVYWAVASEHYRERKMTEFLRSHDPKGQAKAASMGLYACLAALNGHLERSPLDQRALGLLQDTADLLEHIERRFPNHGAFRRPGFDD